MGKELHVCRLVRIRLYLQFIYLPMPKAEWGTSLLQTDVNINLENVKGHLYWEHIFHHHYFIDIVETSR